jgi:predicted nucleic acid-binding protein
VRLESEAKLKIQEEIRIGNMELIWSYILDYENNKNPFIERRHRISEWKKYTIEDVDENHELKSIATSLNKKGFHKIDSLHLACAIFSKCKYFITTDDQILKLSVIEKEIKIVDPIGFIKEVLS